MIMLKSLGRNPRCGVTPCGKRLSKVQCSLVMMMMMGQRSLANDALRPVVCQVKGTEHSVNGLLMQPSK